jgi:hypothetical protein
LEAKFRVKESRYFQTMIAVFQMLDKFPIQFN